MKFSNTRARQITEEEREQYREWGRQGGKKVHEMYGGEHMSNIGKTGAQSTHDPTAPPREPKPRLQRKAVQALSVQPDNLEDFI